MGASPKPSLLPLEALQIFLAREGLIETITSPIEVQKFSGGFSNLTYRLDVEGKTFVLRRPPDGVQVKRGHDMGREYKVLSRLKAPFSCVPQTFVFTEDTSIIGAPFYLMEHVEGLILHYKTVAALQLSPQAFPLIADAWLNTFVALHKVDYEAAGLADLGHPEGYVARQVANWAKQYTKAATEDLPLATKVMQWMADHQPKTYQAALIHNDYKYDNIVFKDTTWQEVRAVLDWEMATIGDPLMDLGTSLGYWMLASDPEPIRAGLPLPTVFEGNPSRLDLVQAYAQKSGRDVSHLVFYYGFGLFKIAVIAQQIYYRYHLGYTKDPRFASLNQVAAVLIQTAWHAIQRQRIEGF